MKTKLIKYLTICLSLFSICFILINNKVINENIIYAINLWITKVFPSLFPMFVINEILIYTEFPTIITKLLCKVSNKLNINTYAIYVFIMSIFSGAPSNALILKKLVENQELSSKDASYILSFTFFSNPLFLYTMLNNIFNNTTTIKIIIINYLSNILLYLLFHKKISSSTNNINFKNKKIKMNNIINNSIKKSLDTLLIILGTITLYIIISTIVLNCFDFSPTTETIIKGFLEITQGLSSLSNLTINNKLKEIIAISIISFGGLSIHSQINNILLNSNIKYKYFFIGRLITILISAFITIMV